MIYQQDRLRGFTAVEVLVTIVVAMVFIGAVAQMYTAVVNDAADVRNRASASAVAYVQLRAISSSLTSGSCTPNASVSLPVSADAPAPDFGSLPSPRSITASISCPYSGATYATNGPTAVSQITVTITYGNPAMVVRHVIYKY